ncbi:MAG: M1 family metallopeptidase [Saprospirales bacterium]|nr:M1 family metallopeptidase [Saprospirales bacterium]
MNARFRLSLFFFLLFSAGQGAFAQCDPYFPQPLSRRPANYTINATLDDRTKTIDAAQTVRFTNQSPAPIRALRFYLYLNAFKNTESSFLKGTTRIFGQGFTGRGPGEWGWIDVEKIERERHGAISDLTSNKRYIQPDDGNAADQTVLEVPLDTLLLPGETAVLHLKWRAKMPKTIARAGYSQDFYLFCHWFPQLGVFEQNNMGIWDWNCHQFLRQTEFYADFGVYDVQLTTDKKFVAGATGCLVSEKNNPDGTVTRRYHAEDVIDFAWSVYPRFRVLEDRWQGVQIRLLLPPEHLAMGPRYLHALKFALAYLDEHVGRYPYPVITVVDPPFHGLRSGLMEYPTFITAGTFYGMPENIRTSESLVVHEFVHQYFMGMVANNEKEEPWLDEGFVTYFEDRIIDAAYGDDRSVADVAGYRFGNRALTRLEYTTLRNPRSGAVARPGWQFTEANYKPLIYSKTATALRTVQALVGEADMDRILRAYFDQWKFRRPRGRDFMAAFHAGLMGRPDSVFAQQVYGLFETSIYDALVLDYAVTRITNEALPAPQGVFGGYATGFTYRDGSGPQQVLSKVEVQRKGDWVFPVDVRVTFEDGSAQTVHWPGVEGLHVFTFHGPSRVVSAQIDPQQKLALDTDLNNNSLTLKPDTAPLWKYAAKAVFWIQNFLQTVSFLV